jgi:hypothetical protein
MSIDAMKLALEALLANVTGTSGRMPKTHEAIAALRQAIEAAEQQEPVAYAHYEKGRLVLLGRNDCCMDMFALYRDPPRRDWVELTEEDIERCADGMSHYREFARAIEQASKEKNT